VKIGVDFDNTIVCYDDVFYRAATEQGLIPQEIAVHKGSIRDYLRSQGKEDSWTELQGLVYGKYIKYALPFPGVLQFFRKCVDQEIMVCIISHKTRFPFLGEKYDLHAAADRWLEAQGFYAVSGPALKREQVYFEVTKEGKLRRIAEQGCDYYIDDLPEFLAEEGFSPAVQKVLFDPKKYYPNQPNYIHVYSWGEIADLRL
jgi:hypothetical protein